MSGKHSRIYCDYAAATPLDGRVADAMVDFLRSDAYGNPSSIHYAGRAAATLLEESRRVVASYLDATESNEVVFTSGGTEANNLAIRGVLYASPLKKPHIITTPIEHKSILEPIAEMSANDEVDVTYLPVDRQGQITLEDVARAIKHSTVLISAQYVNNEIGVMLPVREIGKYLEKLNEERVRAGYPRIYLHTDAVQALPYLDCRVKHLHVDLLTGSAHKFGGPKGVGFLYIKKRTPVHPLVYGGAQEFEKRPGTQNMVGIIGCARAIELLALERGQRREQVEAIRDYCVEKITNLSLLTSSPVAPHIIPVLFPGIDGASIVINLDLAGIAVSSGSACTSGSVQPSHVLLACGYSSDQARSFVRISLSHMTTREDIDRLCEVLLGIIGRLQK